MVLESVFGGKEKGVNPSKFPSPPTTREMLEDIDSITQDDPILSFARILLHKGTGETDPTSPSTDDDTTLRDILQKDEFKCDWLIDSLAVAMMRESSPQKANYVLKSPISSSSSTINLMSNKTTSNIPPPTTGSSESNNAHTKLKQFSAICTKSEELLTSVEERLREMESECHRIVDIPKTNQK